MSDAFDKSKIFCDEISISSISAIQPFGVLVVIDAQTKRIIQASENAPSLWGIAARDLLQKAIHDLVEGDAITSFSDFMQIPGNNAQEIMRVVLKSEPSRPAWVTAHREGNRIVLEFEEDAENEAPLLEVLQRDITLCLRRISRTRHIRELAETLVTAVRQMSGYDRVMLYRFQRDFTGVVIAEDKSSDMESYLDLHFPANDVPEKVRAMYVRNPVRLIPDIAAGTQVIVPAEDPQSGRPLQASHCVLRSVPDVHIEYLRNMNVQAAMSIAIERDGRLWGLIACHHKTPRYISPRLRETFTLLSQIASLAMTVKEEEDNLKAGEQKEENFACIMQRLSTGKVWTEEMEQLSASMTQLMRAGGFVVAYGETLLVHGETPPKAEIRKLVSWLQQGQNADVWQTDNLSTFLPSVDSYKDVASGMMAVCLSSRERIYCLWFRPEVIQTVTWAGDPHHTLTFDEQTQYHPRNSFAQWKESVRNHSEPFLRSEVNMAQRLRRVLMDVIVQQQSSHMRSLGGILPICSWCRKIRSEEGQWQNLEDYMHQQARKQVTHGICPDCRDTVLQG